MFALTGIRNPETPRCLGLLTVDVPDGNCGQFLQYIDTELKEVRIEENFLERVPDEDPEQNY